MGTHFNGRPRDSAYRSAPSLYANYFATAVRKASSRVAGSSRAYIRPDLNKAAYSLGSLLHLDGADETYARCALIDAARSVDDSASLTRLSQVIDRAFAAGRKNPKTPRHNESRPLTLQETHPREAQPQTKPVKRVSSEDLERFWSGLVGVDDPQAGLVADWLGRRFPGWPLARWVHHDLLRAIPTPDRPVALPSWAACGSGPSAFWNRTPEQHLAILRTFDHEGSVVGLRARAVAEPLNLTGFEWRKSLTGRGHTNGVLADDDAQGLLRACDAQRSIDALLIVEGEPDFLAVGATKPVEFGTSRQSVLPATTDHPEPSLRFAVIGLVGPPGGVALTVWSRILDLLPVGVRIFLGPHEDEHGERYRRVLLERIAIHSRQFDVRRLAASALHAPPPDRTGVVPEPTAPKPSRSSECSPVPCDLSNETTVGDDVEETP